MNKILPVVFFSLTLSVFVQAAPKKASLQGTWYSNSPSAQSVLVLNPDGTGKYDGERIQYQVMGGMLMVMSEDGETAAYSYVLQGDLLTVTGGDLDAPLAFRREGSPGVKTPTAKREPARGASGEGPHADPALAGKWCYVNVNSTNSGGSSSSRCLTLNADGTYEYYGESSRSVNTADFYGGTASQDSDSGKWWVQGDRLHYASAAKGAGSYKLEKKNHPKNGDPMIVLDGEAYVTYYQKARW